MQGYQNITQKDQSLQSGINQYQLSSSLRLYCEQHQSELLTNFCSHPSCLRPLCPDCIDQHNKFHKTTSTFAEIDSIKNIKGFCQKKLNTGISELQRILDELENNMMVSEGEDQTFNQIRRCKEQVIDLIQQYFSKLEDQYRNLMDSNNEKQESLNQMLEVIRNNLNELEFLQANMEGMNALNTIKRVCVLDLKKMIEKFRKQFKQTEFMKNPNQINLNVDNKGLDYLIQNLTKYASIQTIPQQRRIYEDEISNNSNIMMQQQIQSIYQPVQQETKTFQSHISPTQPAPTNSSDYSSYLKSSPYFPHTLPQQTLHFFQGSEKNLWIYELNNSMQWVNVRLDIKEPIPQFSKSIITKKGEIYLTGGTLQQGSKSSSIYYTDLHSKTLKEVGRMSYPRSSHAILALNDGIAIIGGYANKQVVIDQCEFFDPRTGQTKSLGQLNFPVASPGVCTFNENHIMKLGGIDPDLRICQQIEMCINGKWIPLQRNNFDKARLMSMSCCIQIQQQEIMVFGGYSENNQGSNQCFSIIVNNQTVTFGKTLCELPFTEGFWNNNPLIYNGKVYALQNTTDEQEECCLEERRQIICFDGLNWKK